jgi:hypothetical protein
MEFKKLEWNTRTDGVIYAEPNGLEKSYYIYQLEDNLFELTLIRADGTSTEEGTFHENASIAKSISEEHYQKILHSHVK